MVDPSLRTLSLAASTPPIAREYQRLSEALERTASPPPPFDPRPYRPESIAAARSAWVERMSAEHGSFPIFTQLAVQLSEAGAAMDAEAVALRMAQDEIRHAELCGRVVVALGDEAAIAVPRVAPTLARHAGASPEERALRNVIYTTCLSEMVAVARFVDVIDQMEEPWLRDCTRRLLADEVLHGQFGFHYLETWAPWLEANAGVCESLERYLRHALAVLEVQLAGTSPRPWTITDEERALGCPDPARAREVFETTMEGAVLPALERYGIRAQRAWQRRRVEGPADEAGVRA